MSRFFEYELVLSPKAENQLRKISRIHQKAIIETFEEIIEDPLLGKPLSRELAGRFSFRVGSFRIIYKVDRIDNRVIVLRIGPRPKVYN